MPLKCIDLHIPGRLARGGQGAECISELLMAGRLDLLQADKVAVTSCLPVIVRSCVGLLPLRPALQFWKQPASRGGLQLNLLPTCVGRLSGHQRHRSFADLRHEEAGASASSGVMG